MLVRIIHPVGSIAFRSEREHVETAAVCKTMRAITPRYLRASQEHEQSAGACGTRWLVCLETTLKGEKERSAGEVHGSLLSACDEKQN